MRSEAELTVSAYQLRSGPSTNLYKRERCTFPRSISKAAQPLLSPALQGSHQEILSTLILRVFAIRFAISGVSRRLPLS
jgi:hypothetical protein